MAGNDASPMRKHSRSRENSVTVQVTYNVYDVKATRAAIASASRAPVPARQRFGDGAVASPRRNSCVISSPAEGAGPLQGAGLGFGPEAE